jgi:uncharacterized cupin superfamily protein
MRLDASFQRPERRASGAARRSAWRGRRGLARDHDLRWFGVGIYELPEGQWTFPYHYHHGVDE